MEDKYLSDVKRDLSETADLFKVLVNDDAFLASVAAASASVCNTLRAGSKVLVAGNGGSAADAQHIAAELVSRFEFDRAPLPAVALTTDTSILTAIGNDYGYEQLFSRQVRAHGCSGDVFIAISTSGQSRNILAGLEAAGELGMIRIGLTGNKPSAMQEQCEHLISVPSSHTPFIQHAHIAVGHIICHLTEKELFSRQSLPLV